MVYSKSYKCLIALKLINLRLDTWAKYTLCVTLVHTQTHAHSTRLGSTRLGSILFPPIEFGALDAVVHIGVHIQLFFFLLRLLLSFWFFLLLLMVVFCCSGEAFSVHPWFRPVSPSPTPPLCVLLCSLNMYYTCVCECVLLLHAQIYCRVVASMFVWCEMMLMVIT